MYPSSTIQSWAANSINYVWDSVTGFLYGANGKDFTVVFIILVGVVCLVIAGIKFVIPSLRSKKPF